MRISRIHFGATLVVGESITFDKSQSHYLQHVLRLSSGAVVILFNGLDPIDYSATIEIKGKKITATIKSEHQLSNESSLNSEIIQALGRSDHMDIMIQKTTELGANKIILFNAARTQSPLKSGQMEKKLAHWHSVATSACEQCGRGVVPVIEFRRNLTSSLETSSGSTRLLLDFEAPSLSASLQTRLQEITFLLGPEGGLSAAEIEQAVQTGFNPVSLGPRVLRTETAAISALAIAQSIVGDLG